MASATIWGWDNTNKVFVKILVDEDGKLKISDVDPFEITQTTPEDLRHVPHGRVAGNGAYLPFAVDANGKLQIDIATLEHLNDIGDVNVAAPTDGYVLYWDETAGKFQLKVISTTKIIDADADTKVDVEESADEDKIHMDVEGTEAFLLSDVGILTLAKQSRCSAAPDANMEVPSGLYGRVYCNIEEYDEQNEFDNSEKTGAADATEANKLHDADGGFAAGDVGKAVWNTTDDTHAKVSAFVDDGELTLDTDIMANGENYILYAATFTATEAGRYLVVGNVALSAPVADKRFSVYISKNGTRDKAVAYHTSTTSTIYGNIAAVYELAASDYLWLEMRQECGVAKSVVGDSRYTFFQVHKLS